MFELARVMKDKGVLEKIVTGYPRSKLKNEKLPLNMIESYPRYQVPYMTLSRLGLSNSSLGRVLATMNVEHLDEMTAKNVNDSNLISMSSLAVVTARLVKMRGNIFILNRSSHHILSQKILLEEQRMLWNWQEELPSIVTIERELEEYQLADRIIVPSIESYRSFMGQGVDMGKLVINPFPLPKVELTINNQLKKDVLFVGNVTLQKGFPTLVRALNKLDKSDLKLHVAGTYSKKFISHLKKHKLSFENVIFYGPLGTRDLAKLYRQCEVFILPSIHDGWGMVVNEAMSFGCIPVVSNGAGSSDQITHGVNGFVFKAGDVDELANCISKALGNEELRLSMNLQLISAPYFNRTWANFYGAYEI